MENPSNMQLVVASLSESCIVFYRIYRIPFGSMQRALDRDASILITFIYNLPSATRIADDSTNGVSARR